MQESREIKTPEYFQYTIEDGVEDLSVNGFTLLELAAMPAYLARKIYSVIHRKMGPEHAQDIKMIILKLLEKADVWTVSDEDEMLADTFLLEEDEEVPVS